MKISDCVTRFLNCQRMNVKKNTLWNQELLPGNFQYHFNGPEISSLISENILTFIVSKALVHHSNLSTTQIYWGRISDNEALAGLTTCTGKILRIRAEALMFSGRLSQRSDFKTDQG